LVGCVADADGRGGTPPAPNGGNSTVYEDEVLQNIREIAEAAVTHESADGAVCIAAYPGVPAQPVIDFQPYAWSATDFQPDGWSCLGWTPSQRQIHWEYDYINGPDLCQGNACPDPDSDIVFEAFATVFVDKKLVQRWIYGHTDAKGTLVLSELQQ